MLGFAALCLSLGLALPTNAASAAATPLVLAVQVDAEAGTLSLQGDPHAFLRPRLVAAATPDGVRLFLRADGPAKPVRWLLHLEVRDPSGGLVKTIRDPRFTGRGRPPLSLDLGPTAQPGLVRVAALELRGGDRALARSAPVILPAAGATADARTEPRVLATLPPGAEIASVRGRALRALARPGTRLRIEGHWDRAEDADAASETLARGVARALVAEGLDEARLEVVARADRAPRYPGLSSVLRRRNRRVELIEVPPPRPPEPKTRLPAAPGRALELRVDGQDARLPLDASPTLAFTMDLDPPARVQATLHDGRGGWSRLRRSVSTRWLIDGGVRTQVASVVVSRAARIEPVPAERGVTIVDAQVSLTEEGRALDLEIAAPDDVEAWLVVLGDPRRRRALAFEAGEGAPPPRVRLALTASVTRARETELALVTRLEDGTIATVGPLPVPKLADEPLGAIMARGEALDVAFGELLEALSARPEARLVIEVHGGRRAERARARRQMRRALSSRGLSEARVDWSAGRSDGSLTLSGHLSLQASVPLGVSEGAR